MNPLWSEPHHWEDMTMLVFVWRDDSNDCGCWIVFNQMNLHYLIFFVNTSDLCILSHSLVRLQIQSSRCTPYCDNVTWPRTTLQIIHVFDTFMPRHAWARESNKNQCLFCEVMHLPSQYTVSNNTLICVAFICPGMPGQESIKKRCIICNLVLGQVTLSQ